tara:strand:+ start:212 stop:457 length:246 start_codon:yes stop_codon:yes gene_type:complete
LGKKKKKKKNKDFRKTTEEDSSPKVVVVVLPRNRRRRPETTVGAARAEVMHALGNAFEIDFDDSFFYEGKMLTFFFQTRFN